MSFLLAHTQLVTAMGTVVPASYAAELGAGFVHARDGALRSARQYRLVPTAMATNADSLGTGGRRTAVDLSLEVFYPAYIDEATIDAVIVDDYIAIRDVLLSTTEWDQPTSTIENLTLGQSEIMEASLESDEHGNRILRLDLDLEHS